jgi:hypothetical protein
VYLNVPVRVEDGEENGKNSRQDKKGEVDIQAEYLNKKG